METQELTISVVSAGLGQPSSTRLLADRLAGAARRQLEASGVQVRIEVVELRELARDIADNLVTGFPGPALAEAVKAVTSADAVIAVTPIFNASYSGLFKSFFDLIENTELIGKPVLIAATGGTARHSLALEHAVRPLFAYLRAVVVPSAVYAATDDFGAQGLDDRIERAAGELVNLLIRRAAAPVRAPATEEAELVPFAQQLAALEIQ